MATLRDVNTIDIRAAIELGCRTMQSVFNADDHDVPFFRSTVLPDARLSFSSRHSESHVPGRHLNALLNAEDAAAIRIDEAAVEKHARAAFFSYGGALPLPLNRETIGGPLINFHAHNVREGFHALYALIKYRGSSQASELADRSIETIFDLWHPETGWDRAAIEHDYGLRCNEESTFIVGLARAIGPLVKLYRATGSGRALELAKLLADHAVDGWFTADGRYDRSRFGTHTHSTTCAMSSLAQLADLTRDSWLMARVKAFYDNGLWDIRDEVGWVIENSGDDRPPDRGEANNTGDILETALILGRWGHSEAYADAERILRCHLLPSQLRDVSFISEPPNPRNEDGLRDLANRHLGAWGFPAPYGHVPVEHETISFNMDIVGGATGSLCEALRDASTFDADGHHVNLLFDNETPNLRVESPYTHDALRVTLKCPGPLWIRIPSWVADGSLKVAGNADAPRKFRGRLFFPRVPVNQPVSVTFPLARSEIAMRHRTRTIRVRMRGDAVEAMDGFGADLTYFDPFDS